MFQNVDPYLGDAILGMFGQYRADPRAQKVNLGIGIYQNEQGVVPHLKSVNLAREKLARGEHPSPGYLPGEGDPLFRERVQTLVLGNDLASIPATRVATIQTLGASGALKIGADFLKRYKPDARVWVSTPTWVNHEPVFAGAGFQVGYFPYYNPDTRRADIEAASAFLQKLPAEDIVLLQPCCHNPTGCDLTPAEWDHLCDIFVERRLFPFFDMAYQGFGQGMAEDAYPIRHFAQQGIELFAASSFSKTFSLYEERVGALTVVCGTQDIRMRVTGQLNATIRRNYSTPPAPGARVVAALLDDPALKELWSVEVSEIRDRLKALRRSFSAEVARVSPIRDWNFLIEQTGMFSLAALPPANVTILREEFGIYMVQDGRMCISGLNASNLAYVASAIAKVSAAAERR